MLQIFIWYLLGLVAVVDLYIIYLNIIHLNNIIIAGSGTYFQWKNIFTYNNATKQSYVLPVLWVACYWQDIFRYNHECFAPAKGTFLLPNTGFLMRMKECFILNVQFAAVGRSWDTVIAKLCHKVKVLTHPCEINL